MYYGQTHPCPESRIRVLTAIVSDLWTVIFFSFENLHFFPLNILFRTYRYQQPTIHCIRYFVIIGSYELFQDLLRIYNGTRESLPSYQIIDHNEETGCTKKRSQIQEAKVTDLRSSGDDPLACLTWVRCMRAVVKVTRSSCKMSLAGLQVTTSSVAAQWTSPGSTAGLTIRRKLDPPRVFQRDQTNSFLTGFQTMYTSYKINKIIFLLFCQLRNFLQPRKR